MTSQFKIDVMLVFQWEMHFNLQCMLILQNLEDFYTDFLLWIIADTSILKHHKHLKREVHSVIYLTAILP
jgi:hypothetical protein